MPQRGRLSTAVVLATALTTLAALAACGTDRRADATRPEGRGQVTSAIDRSGPPARVPSRAATPVPSTAPSTEAAVTPPTVRPMPGQPAPAVVRLTNGRVYLLARDQPVAPGSPDASNPPDAPDGGAPGGARAETRAVLVVLHSFGGTWRTLERAAALQRRARAEGLVLAYGIGRNRSWNAGSCCGWAQSHEVDDLSYLAELVADIRRRVPDADPRRVYLTGFSNGAMMTLRALCARPDVFAAGFGVAGQLVGRCAARVPVHYLAIHGTADDVVPYDGGRVDWLGLTFPPVGQLPDRIATNAPGSVVEIRRHPCGHVWATVEPCGIDASAAGLRFVRGFALDDPSGYRASGRAAVS